MSCLIGAGLVLVGAGMTGAASSLLILSVGRFITGMSCGLSTVLVPLFLSEVSPPSIRGSVGVSNQLAICFGILIAQASSIPLSQPGTGQWRFISLVSIALAIIQIATSGLAIESPKWLAEQGLSDQLYDVPGEDEEEASRSTDPLLERESEPATEESLTLRQVLVSVDPATQRGVVVISFAHLAQQWGGINSVMYYSTSILSTVSPGGAKYISLFITVVNLFMTFPTLVLIDRLGRRALFLISIGAMAISSFILGYALNHSKLLLAAFFIVMFVASFAFGLGPIPFVLMGEVPPPKARSATASLGLGINWFSNFLVGLLFLPLRDSLPGPGTIFYGFGLISVVGFLTMSRLLS